LKCEASDTLKRVILNAKEEDIKRLLNLLWGYPARGVKSELS